MPQLALGVLLSAVLTSRTSAQSAPAPSPVTYAYSVVAFDPAQARGADLLTLARAQAAEGFSFRGVQRLAEGPFALFRRTDDAATPHARKVKLVVGPTLAPDQRASTFVANLNRYGARGYAVLDGGFLALADGAWALLERDVAGGVVPAADYAASAPAALAPATGRIALSRADFLGAAGAEGAQGYALYERFNSQGSTPDYAGPHAFFLFARPLPPAPARTVGFRLDAHPDPATLTAAAFLQRLNQQGKKGFSLRTVLPLADGDFDLSERATDATTGRRGIYLFSAEATEATPAATDWEALLNAHGARGSASTCGRSSPMALARSSSPSRRPRPMG